MNDIKLKPCPYCSGTDLSFVKDQLKNHTYIMCNEYLVTSRKFYGNKEETAKLWNIRHENLKT